MFYLILPSQPLSHPAAATSINNLSLFMNKLKTTESPPAAITPIYALLIAPIIASKTCALKSSGKLLTKELPTPVTAL
jgi:hypothetical protein